MKIPPVKLRIRLGKRFDCARSFILLLGGISAAFAEPNLKERLAQFIESPPPIREMVVECNWMAPGETNTQWITLSWQPNAYVLRTSSKPSSLYDAFDTNRDDVISVRSNDTYSVVSYYKVLGVHIRQVQGPLEAGRLDIVTPKVIAHQKETALALTAGVPLGLPGAAVRNEDRFTCRNESSRSQISAEMRGAGNNRIEGFTWTNQITRVTGGESKTLYGTIRYDYAGSQAPWFPHEIIRELVVNGTPRKICRLVVHKLDLGPVPLTEFYPERFLPGPPRGSVITSNGLSYITLKLPRNRMETKPVADPRTVKSGKQRELRGRAAVYVVLAIVFLSGPVAVAVNWFRRLRRQPN